MIQLLFAIAFCLFVLERLFPANELPRVHAWWPRVLLVNLVQMGIVLLAGISWDQWLNQWSLLRLQNSLLVPLQAVIAYFISTFFYYWWHRFRHESKLFWLLCHQLHHSPRRIELLTSFYKHPVEILLNSLLSALIVYTLLGCSIEAGAVYTILTALAEYFYHLNVKTPYALGFFIQRPESHRIHHMLRHHTQNFADLPLWDMIFGTFVNATEVVTECGFDDWREDRFEDILIFRDVHAENAKDIAPLKLLPTCIGCHKRWVCQTKVIEEKKPDE